MASPASAPPMSNSTVDEKILADLNIVSEKIGLLEQMLRPGGADSPAPSVKNRDSSVLDVIGFLEACSPRMIELVEAGSQGLLSGVVLEKCLQVNDQLMKQLSDVDTMALTETAASTTVASAPAKDDLEDLSLDVDEQSDEKIKTPAQGGKSTGEEDVDFFKTG